MTRGTRRALVATRLFSPEVGAASFRLRALALGLVEAGADVVVVTTRPPKAAQGEADTPGVRIARAPVLRDRSGNVRGYVQYLSFDIPLFFRLLFRRADVVVAEPPPTTGFMVAVSSWLRRRPFVYYAADVWTDGLIALGSSKGLIAVMRGLEGWVLRRAAAVIAVSDEVAEKVVAFGVAEDRVVTVGNGIDTGLFSIEGERADLPFPTYVYTGIMSEWQGPAIFVEALPRVLAEYPDAGIRFFGHGSESGRIAEATARLGLSDRVVLGGVIPPRRTAEWLRGATAALASITPGLGYDFAKPTKVYAAAACGTPVVFAGTGVAAALVDENGLGWSAPHDPDAVADAMIAAARAKAAGETEAARPARSRWVDENASLSAAGAKAARAVLGAIRR